MVLLIFRRSLASSHFSEYHWEDITGYQTVPGASHHRITVAFASVRRIHFSLLSIGSAGSRKPARFPVCTCFRSLVLNTPGNLNAVGRCQYSLPYPQRNPILAWVLLETCCGYCSEYGYSKDPLRAPPKHKFTGMPENASWSFQETIAIAFRELAAGPSGEPLRVLQESRSFSALETLCGNF